MWAEGFGNWIAACDPMTGWYPGASRCRDTDR